MRYCGEAFLSGEEQDGSTGNECWREEAREWSRREHAHEYSVGTVDVMVLAVGSIALVCVVAAHDIRIGEFDYNVDEAQHAVIGLFVADALRDLPIRHPVQYAYRYYVQYPALAICTGRLCSTSLRD
jgi:hypothetical protein